MSQRNTRNREAGPDDAVGIFWVQCNECDGWEIYDNTDIPGPYNLKAVKKARFVCKFCNIFKKLDELGGVIVKIQDRVRTVDVAKWDDAISKIPSDLQEAKDEVSKILKDNNHRMETEIASYKAALLCPAQVQERQNLSAPQLRQATTEMKDIEARKFNIIVAGLQERTKDKEDFLEFCNDFHSLEAPMATTDIESAERVGNKGNLSSARLLRVRVSSLAVRRKLLMLHKLKKNGALSPSVYIRPDLTKAQQEVDKELRSKLQELGKDRYWIHRGEIVLRDQIDGPVASSSSSSASTNYQQPQNNNPQINQSNPMLANSLSTLVAKTESVLPGCSAVLSKLPNPDCAVALVMDTVQSTGTNEPDLTENVGKAQTPMDVTISSQPGPADINLENLTAKKQEATNQNPSASPLVKATVTTSSQPVPTGKKLGIITEKKLELTNLNSRASPLVNQTNLAILADSHTKVTGMISSQSGPTGKKIGNITAKKLELTNQNSSASPPVNQAKPALKAASQSKASPAISGAKAAIKKSRMVQQIPAKLSSPQPSPVGRASANTTNTESTTQVQVNDDWTLKAPKVKRGKKLGATEL